MTKVCVVVTRAEPGASDTAARVGASGYEPLLSPAIVIAPIKPAPVMDLNGVAALLFTSANGVRAFAEINDRRDVPAYCVGPATYDAAKAAGWSDPANADGDADDLADLVLRNRASLGGTVLHVANEAAAGGLVARLQAANIDARFLALYRAQPARAIAEAAAKALGDEPVVCVLIHSAKGAAAFARLVTGAGLALDRCVLVGVSEASLAPLKDRGARASFVADRPNEDALFAALARAAATL